MRWARRLTGWVLITGLLVVPPVVLVAVVGWPGSWGWPGRGEVVRWLDEPLTETTVIAATVVVGAVVWLLLVTALVVDVLRRLRRGSRWVRHLRLPTPVQAAASGIIGATVLGSPTVTSAFATVDVGGSTATAADRDNTISPPDTTSAQALHPVGDGVPFGRAAGVELVDGSWLPDRLGATVASAATVVWMRRRRVYLPGPPRGPRRDDVDLAALPGTVTAIQTARTDTGTDESPPGGRADRQGALVHPHQLPPGGVGLTGAGAVTAARGVLVTALMTTSPRQIDQARVITTAADLTVLFGDRTGDVIHTPGLLVAANLNAAVTALEQLRDPLGRANAADAGDPRLGAPVVLFTRTPTDAHTAHRLSGLLDTTGHPQIVAVLLGPWPSGTAWEVDADGATGPKVSTRTGSRLCVLTATAAADLLTMHHQAYPGPRSPWQPAMTTPPPPPAGTTIGYPTGVPGTAAGQGSPTGARRPVRLQVIGEVTLEHAGVAVPVRRTAAVQILVLLAITPAGASSDELSAAIWPHLRRHTVAGRIYTSISELRKTLSTASGLEVIDRTGDRYRLNPHHVDVDLWRFLNAVEQAATALTLDERVDGLHAVVGYTGELAAGHTWAWLTAPREATRRHLLDAYTTLAATTDADTALTLLRDALRVDPFNEAVHRRAIDALTATGDTAAIPALLDTYTRRLTTAGLHPSDDIRHLAEQFYPHPTA